LLSPPVDLPKKNPLPIMSSPLDLRNFDSFYHKCCTKKGQTHPRISYPIVGLKLFGVCSNFVFFAPGPQKTKNKRFWISILSQSVPCPLIVCNLPRRFFRFFFQCSCHLWLNKKNARETLKKKTKILTSEQVIYNFIGRGSLIMRKTQQVSGNRLAWDIPKWVAVNCSRSTSHFLHFLMRTQENIERTRQTIT